MPSESYSPEELICKYGPAVVEITSEFIMFNPGESSDATPQLTPVDVDSEAGTKRLDLFMTGNGFFIKGHYIVAPTELVICPPIPDLARYPYVDGTSTPNTVPFKATRILVTVFNVNGSGHSFIYEADLVGVDGAGNIAVLKINYNKKWNLCNPCIEKCHPYFKFGKSREMKDGETVYGIGGIVSGSGDIVIDNSHFSRNISKSILSDHRYLDLNGIIIQECITLPSGDSIIRGIPIVNCQGRVIGMQINNFIFNPLTIT